MILCDSTTETRLEGGRRLVWLAESLWSARTLRPGTRLKDDELEAFARERLGELFPVAPDALSVEVARLGEDCALVIAAKRNALESIRERNGKVRFSTLASGPWKSFPRARIAWLGDRLEAVLVDAEGELEAGNFPLGPDPVEAIEARIAALPVGVPVELVAPRASLRKLDGLRRAGLELFPIGPWSAAHSGDFREDPKRNPWLPFAVCALVALAGHLALGAVSARLDERRAALEAERKERASAFAALAAGTEDARDEKPGRSDALAVIAAFARVGLRGFEVNRISVDGAWFSVEAESTDALAALEAARSELPLADLRLGNVSAVPGGSERFTMEGSLHDGE